MLCLVRAVLVVLLMSTNVLSGAVGACTDIAGGSGTDYGSGTTKVNIPDGFTATKIATLTATAQNPVHLCQLSKRGKPDMLVKLKTDLESSAEGVVEKVDLSATTLFEGHLAAEMTFKKMSEQTPNDAICAE